MKIKKTLYPLFAVLFAAGAAASANAHTIETPATAEVWQRPTFVGEFQGGNVDFSDSIFTIIESIRIISQPVGGFAALPSVMKRINDDDNIRTVADRVNLGPNGLFMYGTLPGPRREEMAPGDRFRLNDLRNRIMMTAYFYAATGGDFAFAQNTGNKKAAADLQTGEFFLTENFAETTEITAAMGFAEARCSHTFVLQSDMVSCACPENLPIEQGGTCIAATDDMQNEMQNTQTQTSGGGTKSNNNIAKVVGIVGIVFGVEMAIEAIANGGLESDAFSFSPDFGYSITESGYAANIGGRVDFRKDGRHLYYAASQTNANGTFGEFRYTSGGIYTGDFWTAAFSETVRGETADYDLSLSADFRGGIWKISPVYRLHSRFDENESETNNSLNLEGVLRINRWTISPSAGFRWKNANNFADNARFRIDAIHRF